MCNFYIYVDTKRKDQVSMRGSVNITFTYSNYFIFQYSILLYQILVFDVYISGSVLVAIVIVLFFILFSVSGPMSEL